MDKWRIRGAQVVRGRRERRNVKEGAKGGREEWGDVLSQRWDHLVNRGKYNRECVCPALAEGMKGVISKSVIWWQVWGWGGGRRGQDY